MSRPMWDEIWMGFAESIAKRSCDPKYQVGAVVVNSENTQVLSIGYNGDQKGGSNQRDSTETGQSGFIHAEINALIKMDYNENAYIAVVSFNLIVRNQHLKREYMKRIRYEK